MIMSITIKIKGRIYTEKLLPVTENFVLRKKISSFDRKFLPVTGNFVLR